jgi:hypothetical protein
MAEFIDAAVAMRWTLVGYEAQLDLGPPEIRDRPRTLEETNWRENQQAQNLADALAELRHRRFGARVVGQIITTPSSSATTGSRWRCGSRNRWHRTLRHRPAPHREPGPFAVARKRADHP